MRAFTRILSDVHFGDRASRVDRIGQLEPLTSGPAEVIFNGDTIDTRASPHPDHTLECRTAVEAFGRRGANKITFLTGNHDPDVSSQHAIELSHGRVVATHGDIVFEDIVPWGRDATIIRQRIAAGRRSNGTEDVQERFALWRRVAAGIPQRHQSERGGLKYAFLFAADTVWPPLRVLRVLRAWRMHATLMGAFAREHWPAARVMVIGHTHRPGITRLPDGRLVINTGSFCPPLGGFAVDVAADSVGVRRIIHSGDEFRVGEKIAEFNL